MLMSLITNIWNKGSDTFHREIKIQLYLDRHLRNPIIEKNAVRPVLLEA